MNPDGIAIVGMSARLPGARDVDTFWRNIKDGVESITQFSVEDLEIAPPSTDGGDGRQGLVCAKGLLDDVDMFDAPFFGYLPREVEIMDPQHRLFLELCWEAMEHAGYDPDRYPGAVGVFGGCYMDTYLIWNLCSNPKFLAHLVDSIQVGSLQTEIGNDKDYLATRVAFKLGLRGPAMTIQTACSTSLVCVATACQNLLAHRCDMALAGAVTVVLPQLKGYYYREGGMRSPDGHCRPFDEHSAGTVFSNGAAVVLLKRVADAVADGDSIYAVIRGYGTNNDGNSKSSYSAPSVHGQAEVISMALAMAEIDARTIGYVEAHGTATPVGDPIEIAGLTTAYRQHTPDSGYCAVGSVKANLGHLDVAAGAIGLIKAALSVHEGVLPPAINFTRPNPKIDFAGSPFYVNTQLRSWPAREWPRRAGVSSFGVGGTNGHVVVEQAPELPSPGATRGRALLLLSARSDTALAAQANKLASFLDAHPDILLEDVAYTLQAGRREFEHRRFVVTTDVTHAAALLRGPAGAGETGRPTSASAPGVVFMFPGQGTQYPGMARELHASEPVFRDVIDRCCDALTADDEHAVDLRPYLLWDPDRSHIAAAQATSDLAQTRLAQPAIFAVEMALARLFESWGIRPASFVGHSVGEFAAACLAGVFTLEDAVRLVATRGRLMQAQPPGSMLAVRASVSRLDTMLPTGLAIAAINAPELTVVSGPTELVVRFGTQLAAEQIQSSLLVTSHAYHSPMMAPARQPLVDAVAAVPRGLATRTIVSTSLARAVDAGELCEPEYWGQQLMSPVRFADAVTVASTDDSHLLLEVGPGQTLTTLSRQVLARRPGRVVVPSLGSAQSSASGVEHVLSAVGKLWVAGVTADWAPFQAGRRRRVALPTYPFERKRYWVEPLSLDAGAASGAADGSRVSRTPNASGSIHRREFAEMELGHQASRSAIRETPTAASALERGPDAHAGTGRSGRRDDIVARVRGRLQALSGLSIDDLGEDTPLVELGFDSLFLSQVCLALEVEFGVPITLRQFVDDLTSISRLADYLDSTVPNQQSVRAASTSREPADSVEVKPTRASGGRKAGPALREARFDERELAGIFEVLRQAFPSFYGACSLPDFIREQRHKWLENPERTSDHVYGWVLETAEAQIVGFVGLLPLRMKIGDCEVVGAAGCALAVLPAFRNYSLLLSKRMVDWGDRHFLITTTANDISGELNKALGLRPIPIPDFSHQLLWLIRPEATAQFAIGRSRWRALQALTGRAPGSYLLTGLARLWFINHRNLRFDAPTLPVEPVESFTDEFDALWERNKQDYVITTVRSRAFLNWRHCAPGSLVGRTSVFACRENGRILGYVAVQARSPDAGYLAGHYLMTDLFYERARKDVLHNLMNHAFAFVKAHGGSVFQVSGYSADLIEELKAQRPRIRKDRPCPFWYQSPPGLDGVLGEAHRWWPSGVDGDSNL